MIKRTATAETEPEESNFPIPSQKEHLFQVSDIYDQDNHPEGFDITDPDTAIAKVEVVGGDEEGRGMLIQCTLDDSLKKFYYTRMFLKAIGCQYKGSNFPIDSEQWQGRQFYATVVHTKGKNGKTFANVLEYNFDKVIEQGSTPKPTDEIAWDDDLK